MKKVKSNYRLSVRCKTILAAISQKLGLTQTSVVELAIHKLAEQEKVKVD